MRPSHLAGLMILIGAGALTGCATAHRNHATLNLQELEGRVLHLERLAAQRDQDLAQLRDDLETERQTLEQLARQLKAGSPSTSSATTSSAQGMTIREIQAALQRAGFDPGPIDGKMGKRTRQALRAFQQAHGLMPDGRVGPQTIAKLRPFLSPPTAGEK